MSMNNNHCEGTPVVACNLLAFKPEERIRYQELRKELMVDASFEEIPNGYVFYYPNQYSALVKIAEWISYENRCCPFIRFFIYVSGEADLIKVKLTGDEAVKNLLKEEFL
ncbi:hypothetical protein [Sutcliffiella halmapala]|uniref:hypothetical protein n=1 Tax=Sutcliffiella halmapala TaxID=79882 RepID=UPI0009953618|nr:hypothetical protein [Sutcliffiella halmapala]